MESKTDVRRRGRVLRAEIGDEGRAQLDRLVLERVQTDLDWAEYLRVMLFLPIARQREIDTWPLVRWIWATWPRIETYVPRAEEDAMAAVRLEPETELEENRWGIPEPVNGTVLPEGAQLDLIITPLLGFDGKGHRVGYGHGFYDHFLAQHPDASRIGLGYEALLVPDGIAAEEHDVRVQGVITERQHYVFGKQQ